MDRTLIEAFDSEPSMIFPTMLSFLLECQQGTQVKQTKHPIESSPGWVASRVTSDPT